MSRKPESRFIETVHRRLPDSVYRQAMSGMFNNGTPDRYYEGPAGHLWIEYKVGGHKNPIALCTPLQQRWINRARKNNQPVWVATRFYQDCVYVDVDTDTLIICDIDGFVERIKEKLL